MEELNKVSQDLENVQLRNRELVEEIERLRAAQEFVNVNAPQAQPKVNIDNTQITQKVSHFRIFPEPYAVSAPDAFPMPVVWRNVPLSSTSRGARRSLHQYTDLICFY